MTEKIGLIKNPLTIIAIFAGIAEVSGTIVTPFISEANQRLFIYFLISFPTLLVILFFATLIFKPQVLYAPSDWNDQKDWITVNRFNLITQQQEIFKLDPKDSNINLLEGQINEMKSVVSQMHSKQLVLEDLGRVKNENVEISVNKFWSVHNYISYMKLKGYNAEVYHEPYGDLVEKTYEKYEAIWLGQYVEYDVAVEVIKLSKDFYPHLKYINIIKDINPTGRSKQIFIGGATAAAQRLGISPMGEKDFDELSKMNNIKDYHKFINSFLIAD